MRERSDLILKLACGVLAALLVFQLVRSGFRANPLRSVHIPELPTLPANPGSPAASTGTNTVGVANSATNTANAMAGQTSAKTNTSFPAPVSLKSETNSGPASIVNQPGTNTNSAAIADKNLTNISTGPTAAKPVTNAPAPHTPGDFGGPTTMSPTPGAAKPPEISPLHQARLDRIVQSEILAAIMRPMPMALLGIAGSNAFLRSPNGQTGIVKEGDELGGLKLVRIGVNRVLVEQEGAKKELTIFSGYGGESLMPKEKEATNEITIKTK